MSYGWVSSLKADPLDKRRLQSLISRIESEDGQGMVEFAVVAGLFCFTLLGIMEFGLAAWSRNSVASDAREGSRYAIVHGARSAAVAGGIVADSASVATYVKSKTQLGNSIRVRTVWPTDKEPGSVVKVSVAYTVPRRGPILPAHTDSATSTMHIVF